MSLGQGSRMGTIATAVRRLGARGTAVAGAVGLAIALAVTGPRRAR